MKCFGVNALASRGLGETCVKGQEFTECSISVSTVLNFAFTDLILQT